MNTQAISNPASTETLNVVGIKDFVQDKGYVQVIPEVRANANGYPFLTFVDADNKAENIYFSKSESEGLEKGQQLDQDYIKSLRVAETSNANGEIRWKLTTGNSTRISLDFL